MFILYVVIVNMTIITLTLFIFYDTLVLVTPIAPTEQEEVIVSSHKRVLQSMQASWLANFRSTMYCKGSKGG